MRIIVVILCACVQMIAFSANPFAVHTVAVDDIKDLSVGMKLSEFIDKFGLLKFRHVCTSILDGRKISVGMLYVYASPSDVISTYHIFQDEIYMKMTASLSLKMEKYVDESHRERSKVAKWDVFDNCNIINMLSTEPCPVEELKNVQRKVNDYYWKRIRGIHKDSLNLFPIAISSVALFPVLETVRLVQLSQSNATKEKLNAFRIDVGFSEREALKMLGQSTCRYNRFNGKKECEVLIFSDSKERKRTLLLEWEKSPRVAVVFQKKVVRAIYSQPFFCPDWILSRVRK